MRLEVLCCSISVIFLLLVSCCLQETAAGSSSPHNCPEKCGNLTIPKPFGIGKGCFLADPFEVTCNVSSGVATLSWFETVVDRIKEDHVRIKGDFATTAFYNKSGSALIPGPNGENDLGGYYSFSHTRNKFVAVGCDIFAYIADSENRNYVTGCASFCNQTVITAAPTSHCHKNHCCEATIPKDFADSYVWVNTMNTDWKSWYSHNCSFALVVDKDFSDFNGFRISSCNYTFDEFPLVLDWSINGNMNISCCSDAMKRKDYACGKNSHCVNSSRGVGYLCGCLPGFHGTPYLPYGCEDIDECKLPMKNRCPDEALCVNIPGSYYCACRPGYRGRTDGHGLKCLPEGHGKSALLVSLGVGLSTGLLLMMAMAYWFYRQLHKRNQKIAKEKFFKRNGGLLLQQQISSKTKGGGSVFEIKLFPIEELVKATDNFNECRILGKGGLGTVYKGMLSDGSIVAVKKSNKIDKEDQVEQFINEVFILSQINHRHIVKLFGCCLETEVPLLVYEYVSNGTLSQHLHHDNNISTTTNVISWDNRLRIAAEIASALAYMHSCASTAIFHRDIKSSNILLDENLRAVVSDFGLSRSVPIDKTHVTTLVGGTFGYLDPEYFRSGQLNDKSDVYAFGVVLAELLTGQKAVSSSRSNEGLVIHFRSSMKENRLLEILEKIVADEGQEGEILAVAKIAKRCLKLNARKRPSMKEVSAELDHLRRIRDENPLQHAQLSFRDNHHHRSVSEISYSCTVDAVTEDSQELP